jgi:hypothetical protein
LLRRFICWLGLSEYFFRRPTPTVKLSAQLVRYKTGRVDGEAFKYSP